jgi:ligand-binding sensor domain-containing protein
MLDAQGQWVCQAAFEIDGTPWIATCDGYRARGAGLATFDDDRWRYIGAEDGLASQSVRAVAIGPSGQIAAGTDRGLSLYRDGQWRTLRHGLALNRITTLAVTPDGAAWFGFGDASFPPAGGGVSRFDGQRWEVIDHTTDLPINDNVRVLAVDQEGRLWAAAGCELAYRAGEVWHRVAGCEDLRGNVIDIAADPAGFVWVATDFDVYRFDGGQWTTWESLLPTSIAVTQDGGVLIGQSPMGEGGVWAFDGDNWQRLAGSPSCLREMVSDGEGTIWAVGCEANVLYRWAGDTWNEITAADGLPSGRVAGIATSTTGELWVAAESGISRLGSSGWEVYKRTWQGDVRAIAIAPDRSIWLGTSRGAVHVPPP